MLTSAIFRGELPLWVAGGADLTAPFIQCLRLKRLFAAVVFAACQLCFIFGSAQIVTQSRVPDQMANELGLAKPSVASNVSIRTPAVHDPGVKRAGLEQISKLDTSVDSVSGEQSLRHHYGSTNRDAEARALEDSSNGPVDNHLFPPPFPGSFAHDPAVEVRVYDYVGLKDASLQRLTSVVQEILRGAGIFAHVAPCTRKTEPSCQRAEGSLKCLSIRLVASTNETSRYGLVLGKSFVVDDRGGNYASIFLREIHDTAAEVDLPQDLLAAYAVAHEVGHLLLGASCHTPRGLMKAHWERADYKQMKEGWLYFSADQSRLLATVYGVPPAENVAPSAEQKASALPGK